MTAAIAPAIIAVMSFILRVFHLGSIKSYIFDEVYYVDNARDYLHYGVEVTGNSSEFVVHPPVGKWMIALGMKLFGDNPVGWRISSAIIGTLAIIVVALIAHRLFYSPLITGLASLLMALDGLALVHSRTALLDNFLSFFILVATYFFVTRKYLWSGFFLGLALATKWSALYFIALFGLIAIYRAFAHHTGKDLVLPSLKRFLAFGVIPIATYLLSWTGWFLSDRGWKRFYSGNPISSLIEYHKEMWVFHTNLTQKHNYQANPFSWMIQGRPTSFFYDTPKNCGSSSCAREVLALGTPLLWWLGTLAVVIVLGLWIKSVVTRSFEPALNIITVGIVAGYLPWFAFQKRTVFSFYQIIFEPFVILALAYCAKLALDAGRRASGQSYLFTQAGIGLILLIIGINFVQFLPVFMGSTISYDHWISLMWLESWI